VRVFYRYTATPTLSQRKSGLPDSRKIWMRNRARPGCMGEELTAVAETAKLMLQSNRIRL